MDFDQFVSEYIAEDHDFEQLSVMVLEGCRVWYPLTAEAEKQKLQEVMEKAARAAAGAHRFGRYVFFLYDQTGEEQYRTWIERNAEWLKNSPAVRKRRIRMRGGFFPEHIRQCDVCGVSILYGV